MRFADDRPSAPDGLSRVLTTGTEGMMGTASGALVPSTHCNHTACARLLPRAHLPHRQTSVCGARPTKDVKWAPCRGLIVTRGSQHDALEFANARLETVGDTPFVLQRIGLELKVSEAVGLIALVHPLRIVDQFVQQSGLIG